MKATLEVVILPVSDPVLLHKNTDAAGAGFLPGLDPDRLIRLRRFPDPAGMPGCCKTGPLIFRRQRMTTGQTSPDRAKLFSDAVLR